MAATAAIAVLLLSSLPLSARAQAAVEQWVEQEYPQSLRFRARASAGQEIVEAVLRYEVVGRGTSAFARVEDVQPAPEVEVEAVVETNTGNSYIPVGSRFRYHWEFGLADGTTVSGPEEAFVYLPPDRDWKTVENEVIRVFYYGDREGLAEAYLQAGSETYQRLARDLFGIELPVLPVHVVLFATESELEEARPGRGSSFDAAVVTCGTKVASDVVLVIPASCGTGDRTDTLRHELAHIINEAAGEGPLGKLPSWLDEGVAVLAQSEPGANYAGAFEAAARVGRLIPFAEMGTPPNDVRQVDLFYGQAYAMVRFLLDEYGEEALAELFATIKGGQRFDRALEAVYGMTLQEFEDRFLAAYSAGAPTPTPTPAERRAEPTPTPPVRRELVTTADEEDEFDPVVVGAFGSGLLFLLLAAFFALFGVWSRTRAAQAPPPPSDEDRWRRPPSEPGATP